MATELIIATEKVKSKVSLLLEYINFAQVFSKEVTDHVPLSCPYDNEINLVLEIQPFCNSIFQISFFDILERYAMCAPVFPLSSSLFTHD